jgi:hypothetical protein
MATDQTQAQLSEYYKLNTSQLRWSFWSSLIALFAGLIALLSGVALVLRGDSGLATQLTLLGGVLTEFIAAGFFYLFSRNIKQLNVFYDKLIKHQDTLYAISLANGMQEPERTNCLKSVIGNLLSRGEPPFPAEVLKAYAPKQSDG